MFRSECPLRASRQGAPAGSRDPEAAIVSPRGPPRSPKLRAPGTTTSAPAPPAWFWTLEVGVRGRTSVPLETFSL